MLYIQIFPRGKVNILRGRNVCNSKQKCFKSICPIPNGFQDGAVSLHNSQILDKKYYALFIMPVFIVLVTKLVQFT
jgi:hypothetical protein